MLSSGEWIAGKSYSIEHRHFSTMPILSQQAAGWQWFGPWAYT